MNDQDITPDAAAEGAQTHGTSLVLPAQRLPDKLYVIPIHNRPFFPAQVLPVIVNQQPWGKTLERVGNTDHRCLAVFYVDTPPGDSGEFDLDKLPEHGTLVRVHHASEDGGKLQFVAQGLARVRIRG
jgi:ATP-dependent Lon protease